jgi:hypothetical protein
MRIADQRNARWLADLRRLERIRLLADPPYHQPLPVRVLLRVFLRAMLPSPEKM